MDAEGSAGFGKRASRRMGAASAGGAGPRVGAPDRAAVRPAAEAPRFLEGAAAFHRDHGRVDVLAVVGAQRLIRVQTGRGPSEIAVLAVHVDELSVAGGSESAEPPDRNYR